MALDTRYFPLILDVLDQGVFTVDHETRITSFNRAAERITGYLASDLLGKACSDIFRTLMCDSDCPLRQSIQTRQSRTGKEVYLQTKDGRRVPVSVSTAPLLTSTGELLGGVEVFQDLSSLLDLERRLEDRFHLFDLVGRSRAMQDLFKLLPLVAESNSTLLITGASGTGKELVARTVHAMGPRARHPFVAINCAAIPESLLESELFGHAKGAFTDARKERKGRIGAAEKGTLFLDEIGDLPKGIQVKLLRFLQGRSYEPLGSNQSIQANVRIVAATHRDLRQLIATGDFREDLYFRLNVVQIHLPELRDRTEDIPLLLDHLLAIFRSRTGKAITGFSPDCLKLLLGYEWPGNVRELENMVERAFVVCGGSTIDIEHLPQSVVSCMRRIGAPPSQGRLSAAQIRQALDQHNGNQTLAAKALGVHRVTLYRQMKRLGLA